MALLTRQRLGQGCVFKADSPQLATATKPGKRYRVQADKNKDSVCPLFVQFGSNGFEPELSIRQR